MTVAHYVGSPSLAWGHFDERLGASVSVLRCAPPLGTSVGAGAQASFLAVQYQRLACSPTGTLHPLGWLVPATARIPVLLADVPDADWHLEPDELGF